MVDYDTGLMERVNNDDNRAFEELFNRHYKRAVSIAFRFIGDIDSAEDIVMDSFAAVYKMRKTYKPTAKFSTFLFRILANKCINYAKKRKPILTDKTDALLNANGNSNPEDEIQKSEIEKVVRKAINSLPHNQRLSLILVKYEGQSYASAAEILGVSVGAIESLLHRAKESLRKSLGEYFK